MNKTEQVAIVFRKYPNEWISALTLMAVGGQLAWRTEVSRCRKAFGWDIQNRVRHVKRGKKTLIKSEYMRITKQAKAA